MYSRLSKSNPSSNALPLDTGIKKLTKHNRKAAVNYRKYLGGFVSKAVKKHLPGFVPPQYAATNNYVRAGNQITLLADEEYYKLYPQYQAKIFIHHFHLPYLYLLQQLEMEPSASANRQRWMLQDMQVQSFINLLATGPYNKVFFEGVNFIQLKVWPGKEDSCLRSRALIHDSSLLRTG